MGDNKLGTRDLISIGVFGAIIFVLTMISSMIIGMTMVSYLFIASGMGLLSAPVYFLAAARSGKRFVSFFIWTLNGVIWGIIGGYSVLVSMIICALIGELILRNGGYKSFFRISIAYILGVLGYHIGVFVILYVSSERYIEKFMATPASPSRESVMALVNAATGPLGIVAVAAVIAASIISCLLASKILKKHFKKAGII